LTGASDDPDTGALDVRPVLMAARVPRKPPEELTDEVRRGVVNRIGMMLSLAEAARAEGIPVRALRGWRARGREYAEHLEHGGGRRAADERYLKFWLDTESARELLKRRALGAVTSALDSDNEKTRLDAAKFVLERGWPDEWGRAVRVDVSGRPDDADAAQDGEEAQRVEALRLLDELAPRRKKSAGGG